MFLIHDYGTYTNQPNACKIGHCRTSDHEEPSKESKALFREGYDTKVLQFECRSQVAQWRKKMTKVYSCLQSETKKQKNQKFLQCWKVHEETFLTNHRTPQSELRSKCYKKLKVSGTFLKSFDELNIRSRKCIISKTFCSPNSSQSVHFPFYRVICKGFRTIYWHLSYVKILV